MYAKIKTAFLAFFMLLITSFLIIFPEESLHASVRGLHTWWEIVFPSLLPFFIVAELLISFGVVPFIGVLFEPVMRPLFNVPGVGSFAWMLGMVSGYPSGAKITVLLRERNELSQIEAERLVSFSNASSPLFIFGAIAVGFFHEAKLGLFIAFCHYVSNFLVGLTMRFYGKNRTVRSNTAPKKQHPLIKRAFIKMHYTRISDPRPIGKILGDAVISSIQTLIMIGGFIILFSVITTLLQTVPLATFISFTMEQLTENKIITTDIINPLFTGIFEITMGAEMISKMDSIPLIAQLAMVSFILGFNGFSIQAQVASILAKTDVRFLPYFFARLLHALLACTLTITLYSFFLKEKGPYHETTTSHFESPHLSLQIIDMIRQIGPLFTLISLALATSILLFRKRKLY